MTIHRFTARTTWSGSTAAGYADYDRSHQASCPPAGDQLTVTADPAYLGRADQLNPEQLVTLAASSCQLLSFLAAASRARVDVVAYEDEAQAVLPDDRRPVRLTAITLRPRITVAAGTSVDTVLRLVDVGHRECFIANSLACPVTVEATVVVKR